MERDQVIPLFSYVSEMVHQELSPKFIYSNDYKTLKVIIIIKIPTNNKKCTKK